MTTRAAVAQCDRALALLAGAGPRERVPALCPASCMDGARWRVGETKSLSICKTTEATPRLVFSLISPSLPGAAGLLGRAAPGLDGVGVAGDAIDLAAHEGPVVVVSLRRGRLSRPFCSQ